MQPSQEQPSQEQPSQEQATQEQPSQEQPSQEQPSQEQPSQEQPSQEQPSQEQEQVPTRGSFLESFQVGQYLKVYQELTALGKILFIIRLVFIGLQLIWIIVVLSLTWSIQSALPFNAMFLLWLLLVCFSLNFPLYYCIAQAHHEQPAARLRERNKRVIYRYCIVL